jgi:hypothetical protein
MGFLRRLFRSHAAVHAAVQPLPAGGLIVSRDGKVVASTISSVYPQALLRDIARDVLLLLRQAREVQMPLAELSLHFASLRVTAREMRGGAVIFLSPQKPCRIRTSPFNRL